jgi:hypothetical protein
MLRFSLILGIVLVAASLPAHGQLPPGVTARTTSPETPQGILAARAIRALQKLDQDVIVYRSLGEFTETGRLGRVPFPIFAKDLQEVTNKVEPILSALPESRLKNELSNALDSYRDGAFWWQRVAQARVVHGSALKMETTRSSSETAFLETVPYTVAIHWRQARKYLERAQKLIN